MADHADVLGHFHRGGESGELDSSSGFNDGALRDLYRAIAKNIKAGADACP